MPITQRSILVAQSETTRRLRDYVRRLLMPGLDLFTRRRVRLKQHWKSGSRQVLDAGSGNGWFFYLAVRSGAKVTAVSALSEEVEKGRAFYDTGLKIAVGGLEFM